VVLTRGGGDNCGNTTINRGLKGGKREGGREADAIVTVIVALEAAETTQRATTARWEERDKATALTKQQAPTPAEVQVLKG
jgi:alkyl hydroperoxide reductase subunit AhpC